jgi:hypothetical protein
MHQVQFTRVSRNAKTGPIPVTTTAKDSCPDTCPLKENGCYADGGPLAILWRKVSERKAGVAWDSAMNEIRKLPQGQLWRHNQAGDLPSDGTAINAELMRDLVKANRGKNGFTYTHHRPEVAGNADLVAMANREGFTVNLSADNLERADQLAALDIAPVVVVLPSNQMTATKTPSGRAVAICPAILSDSVNCATCGLCASTTRKAIIGFPAHGASKRKASTVAMGQA